VSLFSERRDDCLPFFSASICAAAEPTLVSLFSPSLRFEMRCSIVYLQLCEEFDLRSLYAGDTLPGTDIAGNSGSSGSSVWTLKTLEFDALLSQEVCLSRQLLLWVARLHPFLIFQHFGPSLNCFVVCPVISTFLLRSNYLLGWNFNCRKSASDSSAAFFIVITGRSHELNIYDSYCRNFSYSGQVSLTGISIWSSNHLIILWLNELYRSILSRFFTWWITKALLALFSMSCFHKFVSASLITPVARCSPRQHQ
jgi:hypothetical protein